MEPIEDGEKEGKRRLSTTIYYLLTPDRHDNFIHMNKSTTMHVLHQGRAEYVLIYPQKSGNKPIVKRVVMGPDVSRGEVRQLYVETGVWKASRLLSSDMEEVEQSKIVADRVGCLITEVVMPGFEWEDHRWMTSEDVDLLFPEDENEEIRRELKGRVRK